VKKNYFHGKKCGSFGRAGCHLLDRTMRILVANDDGIYSPGLIALAKIASRFGDVRIVAPDFEQSSMGQAITASRPLLYRAIPLEGFEAYRVNGTPADCVSLGVYNSKDIDLVVSGINLGTNLGNALWHSGTVAAAKQATLVGLRGIAFSTPAGDQPPDFEIISPWAEKALRAVLEQPDLKLVNINIPENPKDLCWTRQSVRHYDGKVVPQVDPMGRQQFWYTVIPIEQVEEGTDRWAMEQGYASLTPLRVDLTDETQLSRVLSKAAVSAAKK
jgi:5'-nucleotidase